MHQVRLYLTPPPKKRPKKLWIGCPKKKTDVNVGNTDDVSPIKPRRVRKTSKTQNPGISDSEPTSSIGNASPSIAKTHDEDIISILPMRKNVKKKQPRDEDGTGLSTSTKRNMPSSVESADDAISQQTKPIHLSQPLVSADYLESRSYVTIDSISDSDIEDVEEMGKHTFTETS